MSDWYMHPFDGQARGVSTEDRHDRIRAGNRVTRFATSLAQIRREQKSSKAVYGDPPDSLEYGYVRIARSAVNG